MDEVMVLNELDWSGMRTLHVMRGGQAVEREHWMETVPAPCLDSLMVRVDEEKMLGVHHLWMFWMAREMIRTEALEGLAALWWMDPQTKQTVREALALAAEYFWLVTGEDARIGLIQTAPQAAPRNADGSLKAVKLLILGEERELVLREAAWVPKDFVVVTREESNDGTTKN